MNIFRADPRPVMMAEERKVPLLLPAAACREEMHTPTYVYGDRSISFVPQISTYACLMILANDRFCASLDRLIFIRSAWQNYPQPDVPNSLQVYESTASASSSARRISIDDDLVI